MDIREIRLQNMLSLAKEVKGLTALAKKSGVNKAYLSQLKSQKLDRTMGDLVARKLEVAMSKPHGWMDRIHGEDEVMDDVFTVDELRLLSAIIEAETVTAGVELTHKQKANVIMNIYRKSNPPRKK